MILCNDDEWLINVSLPVFHVHREDNLPVSFLQVLRLPGIFIMGRILPFDIH